LVHRGQCVGLGNRKHGFESHRGVIFLGLDTVVLTVCSIFR
jgi:hypothetical protein